ncbi:MAG: hypothetical protein U0163_10625 [Gemmatimonadaceae bacterium]
MIRVRDVKAQVQGFINRTRRQTAPVHRQHGWRVGEEAETLDPRLTTKAQNGQDIINFANGINGQFGFLLGQVEANPVVTQGAKDRLVELEKLWRSLRGDRDQFESEVEAFNRLLQAAKVEGVVGKKKSGTIM